MYWLKSTLSCVRDIPTGMHSGLPNMRCSSQSWRTAVAGTSIAGAISHSWWSTLPANIFIFLSGSIICKDSGHYIPHSYLLIVNIFICILVHLFLLLFYVFSSLARSQSINRKSNISLSRRSSHLLQPIYLLTELPIFLYIGAIVVASILFSNNLLSSLARSQSINRKSNISLSRCSSHLWALPANIFALHRASCKPPHKEVRCIVHCVHGWTALFQVHLCSLYSP